MTLYAKILTNAGICPNNVAVIAEEETTGDAHQRLVKLTYRDVVSQVEQLSLEFKRFGIQRFSYVATIMSSSYSLVITLLSLFQLGATYFPLSAHTRSLIHSAATIQRMPKLRYVLCKRSTAERVPKEIERVRIENVFSLPGYCLLVRDEVIKDHEEAFESVNLAYIIQTSGTTRNGRGMPVRVPHKCIAGNITAIGKRLNGNSTPIVTLQVSAPTFDPSLVEMLLPLTTKGTIVIPLHDTLLNPPMLFDMIRRTAVTHLFMTPSLFMQFDSADQSKLLAAETTVRDIILGGEPFPISLVNERRSSLVNLWNIYGTTECSVWATLQKVDKTPVSIGEALDDTEICVPNMQRNTGELWIGGPKRICYVGDEVKGESLRPTGDLVHIDSLTNVMTYMGRTSNSIKRLGYRINLEVIAGAIDVVPGVVRSEAIYVDRTRSFCPTTLVAFVVAQCRDRNPVQLRHAIGQLLEKTLPFYARPDYVFFIDDIPMTHHGKTDRTALLRIWEDRRRVVHESGPSQSLSRTDVERHVLTTLANQVPSSPQGRDWWFLSEGGTSIDAAKVTEDLLRWIALSAAKRNKPDVELDMIRPILLTRILHNAASEVVAYVTQLLNSDEPLSSTVRKRSRPSSVGDSITSCRQRQCLDESEDRAGILIVRRTMEATTRSHEHHDRHRELQKKLKLRVQWKVNLEKCVDASPVLLIKAEDERQVLMTYIGSHAGIFSAIDVLTGTLIWQAQIRGRIESSACVTRDGKVVVVGSYDFRVYAFSTTSGAIIGTYATDGEVKSSPVTDKWNHIWVGSHDGNVYCLQVSPESDGLVCLWKYSMDAGVFASCVADDARSRIFACALGGKLVCITTSYSSEPTVSWISNSPTNKPFFSSPSIDPKSGNVIVGCVDGSIYCFEEDGGNLVWSHSTAGPVFSSPCVSSLLDVLFIGSHGCTVTCLNLTTGLPQWQEPLRTPAAVYASPFLSYDGVVVASIDGWIGIVNPLTGKLIAEHMIGGGEGIFSSPVCYEKWIVVGARNNFVYGISIDS
ncbi:uncharacterized protein SPPG_04926 [Spizellomyces punctatus DAOM BR117]|uniref:AMP-dependent synthetase/ligase domain-containing protein n=1 Tax=Spizellomyces punctatus (strain DAOM BR117) TaxID=645134 RepID=A0A0L0HET6_SPIPD|nr:uncharacterized protein SPPG_04926 [Spizellomyces punctatus DAOM BR117]KNC99536.1 hypothetical protein SPPG_04926 [Spizellomyces punctatus DAOM BR117]|eukprot:XP_016607576.1 hypothetical protein SPPG_04926 [Spizellomyces punctatus DAOM BR117]